LNQEISGENTAISNPFQEELDGRWMQTFVLVKTPKQTALEEEDGRHLFYEK
jgi:hypothetical protein